MALDANCSPDSPLADLRAGQFLIAVLLWASAGGLIVITCSGLVVTYHYTISLAERVRMGLGFAPPHHGPDWFLLIALSSGPLIACSLWDYSRNGTDDCGYDALHWFGQIRGSGASFQNGSQRPLTLTIQNAKRGRAISHRYFD